MINKIKRFIRGSVGSFNNGNAIVMLGNLSNEQTDKINELIDKVNELEREIHISTK
jgi:hypothetical protein